MQVKMFEVKGMHCEGCVQNVRKALQAVPGVIDVQVSLTPAQAIISMEDDLSFSRLQEAVSQSGHYTLLEIKEQTEAKSVEKPSFFKKWFSHKKSCCQ
ncbi:MAG: heavy-metal-associated domain-containing protein [Thermoflavifilum aggregans]|nr:heavy-metal-associated domain-containing protein [Thermoflavifilum aggregans]